MCVLYSFKSSPEETRALFAYVDEPDFPPRPVIAPDSPIGVVRNELGKRRFVLVRWGFIPAWAKEIKPGKPLHNARGETVLEKPSFRNAMRRRRCLIPADGYYEWRGDVPGRKQPVLVHRPDCSLFAFAGLWERWKNPADGSILRSFTIVTGAPNELCAAVHDRMPVILPKTAWPIWLGETAVPKEDLLALLEPYPADLMRVDGHGLGRAD